MKRGFRREKSAGAAVVSEGKILIIKVQNLKGEEVWTFPKGHIENTEDEREAAKREVMEETGYTVKIIDKIRDVEYKFIAKDGALVSKTVSWFLSEPVEKGEIHTKDEVLEVKWVDLEEAKSLLKYDSDRKVVLPFVEKYLNSK